jgi:hypothetical protein
LIPVETKTTVDLGNLSAEINNYFNKSSQPKPVQAQKPAPAVVKTEGPKT